MFAIEKKHELSEPQSYCQGCCQWFENHMWIYNEGVYTDQDPIERVLYQTATAGDDDSSSVWQVYNTIDTYECPKCYVQVMELNDTAPDDDSDDNLNWLCGSCGNDYNTKHSAQTCCSGIEGAKPNPAVFARAMSE